MELALRSVKTIKVEFLNHTRYVLVTLVGVSSRPTQNMYVLLERRILRWIFVPIDNSNEWKTRSNNEKYATIPSWYCTIDQDVNIKVDRIDQKDRREGILKKVLKYTDDDRRSVGRPRLRWEEDVQSLEWRISRLCPQIGTDGEGLSKILRLDPDCSATYDEFPYAFIFSF